MESRKDHMVALILAWFFGTLGVHRFYTGHILFGIIQLLTAGGCGIWALIDLICLCFGKFEDAEGNPLANYNPAAAKLLFYILLTIVILSFLIFGGCFMLGLLGAIVS